jgi:hypothetical protein
MVEIYINGTMAVANEGESLSYDDILKLAYEKPVSGYFTIQYTRAGGDKPSGTVLQGQSLIVKRGMVIDAVQTNSA